jgi:hypothetical protein
MATVLCQQWCDHAHAFAAAGKSTTRNWPFVGTGKTALQRVDRGERHRTAPGGRIAPRTLRTVARKHQPTFPNSNSAVEIDKVIAILPF